MDVTVQDYEGKKVVTEVVPDSEDPSFHRICITEIFSDAQIILDLKVARRLGSALKLLAKMAMKEDQERRDALDNHD